jgi:fructokinase
MNEKKFDAIGVASFGPVDCNVSSPTFGFITTTPKPNWANTDVLSGLGLRDEFKTVPFKFDTDVNAPAMAEYYVNARPNQSSSAYITVGTGIGVGLVINGKTVHGMMHPEGGHIQVARKLGDTFEGTCPFHGSCVEGMCSSGALAKRKGCLVDELPAISDDDELWDTCSYYLAQLCATLILTVSCERIVIGGGVLNRQILYVKIRQQTLQILRGYLQLDAISESNIESFITPSRWGSNAGTMGAAFLAQIALNETLKR